VRPAPCHVSLDPAEDRVILEQLIKLREFGLEGLGQIRHEPEQPPRWVAVDDHGSSPEILKIRDAAIIPPPSRSFRTRN